MYLLITIDTEGDNSWARKGYENSTKNARFLPRFQELCDSFGYKPTYLTSYEMAKDEFFVEFATDLLKRNACEVGLHPHPWNSPPEYQVTSDDLKLHPYMIEYPENIIREKVKVLTDLLETRLGTKLCSHRAGRWAFNPIYAKVLCEFGYKVDCSVTPYDKTTFLNPETPRVPLPDYSMFPADPYFLDEADISRSGNLPLLEIPMTVIPNYGKAFSAIYELIPEGVFKRLFRGICGRPVMWFRPTRRRPSDLLRVANKKAQDDSDYIMFMLHSSELMPGCNPMFRDEKEIDRLYDVIQEVFQWLCEKRVKAATCQEFYNMFVERQK